MKPALLNILILLLMSLSAFSQNWRLFRPEGTSYYASGGFINIAFVPDSITPAGQDFVWHVSPKLELEMNLTPTCSHFSLADGPFSQQILETSSGDYIWTSSCGPQMHMKSRPSAPWKITDFPQGHYYDSLLAYPAGDYWGYALGQPDSIRRIGLEYWEGGMLISRDTTEISKTFGWLNPIIMYSHGGGCTINEAYNFLVGIRNVTPGFGPSTVRDYFSMQVGDTIQIVSYCYDEWSERTEEKYVQHVYLNRIEGANDVLTFSVERTVVAIIDWQPAVLTKDTVDLVYHLGNAAYRRLEKDWGKIDPVEMNASGWGERWHFWLGLPYVPYNQLDYFDPSDNCYFTNYSIVLENDNMYAKGLGGPYLFAGGQITTRYRYPNYYRLNGVATGTPFFLDSLVSIAPTEPSFTFQMFPNPVHDFAEVSVPEIHKVAEVKLWDNTGRPLALSPQRENNRFRFDLQGLPNGLYLISISNGKNQAWQRLIKQ